MSVRVEVSTNGQPATQQVFDKPEISIGRKQDNDIILPGANVSRVHAVIRWNPNKNKYVLTNQSINGTKLNGEPIAFSDISRGDKITIGSYNLVVMEAGGWRSEKDDPCLKDEDCSTTVLSYKDDTKEFTLHKGFLTLTVGTEPGKIFQIGKPVMKVGSDPLNDIVIKDKSVLPVHCLIQADGKQFSVRDLSGGQGTYVDNRLIKETHLKPGAVIRLGKASIKFSVEESQEAIQIAEDSSLGEIVGKSPKMREMYAIIRKIASSKATVLIQGETGTGKELVAHAIHEVSLRAGKPFIVVNCAALPEPLIESELFGHEKGAFTHAVNCRKGAFELADGGTVFLDEIGELPLDGQKRLLRVLEEGRVQRVGGSNYFPIDVRVVAATNRNLHNEVESGQFREDLFYRLYIVPVYLPPLRERREDIPLLANHFWNQFHDTSSGLRLPPIPDQVMERLAQEEWPGNVRELKNVIQRAAVMAGKDKLNLAHISFPPHRSNGVNSAGKKEISLKEVEKKAILSALEGHSWNKKAAAQALGIAESTLHEKIKKYGIESR